MDEAEALRTVYRGAETRRLEYKRSMPWLGNGRFKLIRTIAALANVGGGCLVIGYNEQLSGDARFEGLTPEHLATWDVTKVARDVNNHIKPSIDLKVQSVRDEQRKIDFVIVHVPPHGSIPHLCIKDAGKNEAGLRSSALYYRNHNKETTEIGSPEDWLELLNRLIILRKEEIRRLMASALSGSAPDSLSLKLPSLDLESETLEFEDHMLSLHDEMNKGFPIVFLAATPVHDHPTQVVDEAKLKLEGATADFCTWPFFFYLEDSDAQPHFEQDSIWAVYGDQVQELSPFYYWRFDCIRNLFYSAQITLESLVGLGSELDAYSQTMSLAEGLWAIGHLYEALGFDVDNEISVMLKYTGLSESEITIQNRSWLQRPYAGSSIALQRPCYLNELLTRPWNLAANFMVEIGNKMGVKQALPRDFMEGLAKKHLNKRMV